MEPTSTKISDDTSISFEKFKSSPKEFLAGIKQRIVDYAKGFFSSPDMNIMVQFTTDHLAKAEFEGSVFYEVAESLHSILKLLPSEDREEKEKVTNLKDRIEFAGKLHKEWCEDKQSEHLIPQIKKKIAALKENDYVILPYSTGDHMTLLQIIKKGDKFDILLHNEGLGIIPWHNTRQKEGITEFQSTYERHGISKIDDEFLEAVFTLGNTRPKDDTESRERINALYNKIDSLGGTCPPTDFRKDDERFWSHAQIGGSCPVRSSLSLIRTTMNSTTYLEFKKSVKQKFLFRLYLHIKSPFKSGNTKANRMVALEMVQKLKHLPMSQSIFQTLSHVKFQSL